MSLGRPDRGSVENADRLFQILTGLYDELNGLKKSESVLQRQIIQIGDEITNINVNIGSSANPAPFPIAIDGDSDEAGPMGNQAQSTSQARVWVSTPDPSVPNGVNMGALGDGVLQQAVAAGVATPSAYSVTATRIPFGSGVTGGITDHANFTFDSAATKLLVGLDSASAVMGVAMEVFKTQNAGTQFVFANASTGGSAYSAFQVGQSSNLATGSYFGVTLYSSGSTFGVPLTPSAGVLELGGGSGNFVFWVDQNAGDFIWYTKATYPNPPERMRLTTEGILGVGNGSSFPAGTLAQFNRNANSATYAIVSNPNAGTAAEAAVILSQSQTSYTNYLYLSILGSGFSTFGPYQASGAAIEHVTNTSAPLFFSAYGSQAIDFYTTTSRSLRMRITNGGAVEINGVVAPTNVQLIVGPTTSVNRDRIQLYVGGGTDINSNLENSLAKIIPGNTGIPAGQTTGVWSSLRISGLTYTGTSTPNIAEATTLRIDAAPTLTTLTTTEADPYAVHVVAGVSRFDGETHWNKAGGANYERVAGKFISTYTYGTNFWVLQAQLGGSGAQQSIAIDAQAGTAVVAGGASSAILSQSSSVTVLGTAGAEQILHISQFSRASSAGMIADAHQFNTPLIITGTTNITTATGVNAIKVLRPVYNGNGQAKTITHAASLYIENSPNPTNSTTITNAYALWIDDGRVRIDGGVALGGGAAATLGTIGGSGPATAAQNQWLPINIDGNTRFIPVWA